MAGRNLFAEGEVLSGGSVGVSTGNTGGRNLLEGPGFATTGMNLDPQPSEQSFAGGAAQSLLQGATFGFSDEIQSLIAAAVASPFISDKTFSQIMVDARKQLRGENEQFKEENPKTALGLEVVGGLATGGVGAGKTVAAKTVGEAVKQSAKLGAGMGAIAGAGFSDQEEFLSAETAIDSAKGSILTAGLGALSPLAVKAAVKAGELIPKSLPESLLETALKFRPSIDTASRARMTRTALDEGIMPTVKGLEKIVKKVSDLDNGLNKIIDRATERGVLISKKSLFTELKKLRQGMGGAKLDAADDLAQINAVAKAFDERLKDIGKAKLTPREVQDLKRAAYQRIKWDVNQLNAGFAKTEAKKAIVRGAKNSLEDIDPNVQSINRREGDLLQLGDELERVVSRLDNRNLISLDTAVKVGAGSAGGPVGTAVGTGASIFGAPRVKAKTALILENIRKAGEISETINKTLSPELAKGLAIITDDLRSQLETYIEED